MRATYVSEPYRKRVMVVALLFILSLIPWSFFSPGLRSVGALSISLTLTGTSIISYGLYLCMSSRWFGTNSLNRVLERLERKIFKSNIRWFLGGLMTIFILLTVAISYNIFYFLPHINDSAVQYIHAKIFASGHLTAPSHPMGKFFDVGHAVDYQGRWFSHYPPGHIAILSLGQRMGMPWLINPLLGASTILLLYLLGKEIFSEKVGRLAAFLGLCSVQMLIMSSEYMNNATALLFTMAFALTFIRMIRKKSWIYGIACGLTLGMVLLTRPLSAVGIAAPFAFYALMRLRKSPKCFWLPMSMAALAFGACLMLQGLYNLQTTREFWTYAYKARAGEYASIGLGQPLQGESGRHTFGRGLGHSSNNIIGLNYFLFGWPIPSLIFAVSLFLLPRINPWRNLLWISFFSLLGVYIFYSYQDFLFGARYAYESVGFLIVLTAAGIVRAPATWRRLTQSQQPLEILQYKIRWVVALCIVFGMATTLPATSKALSFNQAIISERLAPKNLRAHGIDHAIVFVKDHLMFLSIYYPQSDTAPIIYAKDLGDENRQLMGYYPNRTVYYERMGEIFSQDGKRILP